MALAAKTRAASMEGHSRRDCRHALAVLVPKHAPELRCFHSRAEIAYLLVNLKFPSCFDFNYEPCRSRVHSAASNS